MFRSIVDNGHKFEARVIPKSLVDVLLHLGHNQSGHNGYQRTYTAIKCFYYWKGMRAQFCNIAKVVKYVQSKRLKKPIEKQIFEPGVKPMEFVSMNLRGEFHPLHPKVTGMHQWLSACFQVQILHTPKKQVCRRNSDSLEKSHRLSI